MIPYKVMPVLKANEALENILKWASKVELPSDEGEGPLRTALSNVLGIDDVVITGVRITRCLVNESDFVRMADYFNVKHLKSDGQIHFDANFSYEKMEYDVSFAMHGQLERGFMERYVSRFWLAEKVKAK